MFYKDCKVAQVINNLVYDKDTKELVLDAKVCPNCSGIVQADSECGKCGRL